ncbi:MAG: HNH endonuclease [Sedimentisphaerales bacterium]|nr:HNH endonuclease [Sedimentisphaerales bacterium]
MDVNKFDLWNDQQMRFKKALLEHDPHIWFPRLRGNMKEDDPTNWFIAFVPPSWGRWEEAVYGVHFDFTYGRPRRLPERIRLVIGVETIIQPSACQAFKEEVISRVNAAAISVPGFVLQAQPRKKLLETDPANPIPFNNQSWRIALDRYTTLQPLIEVIAAVARQYHERDAFAIKWISPPGGYLARFPIESYSWRVLSSTVCIKEIDRSVLLHGGSGIPDEIRFFFGIGNMTIGERRDIGLYHGGMPYEAHVLMDRPAAPRTQLRWNGPFSELLQEMFPGLRKAYLEDATTEGTVPKIRFVRRHVENRYDVEFIDPGDIESDIKVEAEEGFEPGREGKATWFYSKQYERNPANREKAIEIHGLSCVVCGFNFESSYGGWGRGYIEAHHTKPLSSLDEETVVNPETDLFPVCANCHRIIHRRRNRVLTIEEVRGMIQEQKPRLSDSM